MATPALRQHQDKPDHKCGEHDRGYRSAQRKPSVVQRIVEEITQRRAKRSGQNEGSPEQRDARHAGPMIKRRCNCQSRTEDERGAFVAQAARISCPVTECSAQGL